MMNHRHLSPFSEPPRQRAAGFTLVEMLVALGIMMLLLTVILVPIRLAFDALNTSRASAQVQQAAVATVNEFETDLRKAVFIFPNTAMEGVTDRAPYTANSRSGMNWPYLLSGDGSNKESITLADACQRFAPGKAEPWGNPARIDFLVAEEANGIVTTPIRPARFLVTYYPRRADITRPYDPLDNPVVLFRAQTAYDNGTVPPTNIDINNTRFPSSSACSSDAAGLNPLSRWMSHNYLGEANLEPLAENGVAGVPHGHTMATPRGMALLLPGDRLNMDPDPTPIPTPTPPPPDSEKTRLQPDSSFVCQDANGDGKIDRVTVNLTLVNYSSGEVRNGDPVGIRARYSRTVNAPNVR